MSTRVSPRFSVLLGTFHCVVRHPGLHEGSLLPKGRSGDEEDVEGTGVGLRTGEPGHRGVVRARSITVPALVGSSVRLSLHRYGRTSFLSLFVGVMRPR